MPEKYRDGLLPVHFYVAKEIKAAWQEFAAERGSSLSAEITEAMRRHLAYPPPVAQLPPPEPLPDVKRPRGRPRKKS